MTALFETAPLETDRHEALRHETDRHEVLTFEYACVVEVTGLSATDVVSLRMTPGVTDVLELEAGVQVQLIVLATTVRTARRACVDFIAAQVERAVVRVVHVVDYEQILLDYFDQEDDLVAEFAAGFSDAALVATALT